MSYFKLTGGTPLHGSVRIGGAKNASYKLMIAALLGTKESRLLNFSHISDVQQVAEIIEYLGAGVERSGERAISIDPATLSSHIIKPEHGQLGRFSTMFIAPLLAKFGKAEVPAPGGDKIGKRPLDRHFDGLRALGARIEYVDGNYQAECDQLTGCEYSFEKNTHTGTETMIIAAVLATGKTVLNNAAEEPEIDDLIAFLNAMGAKIERRLNRTIVIEGVEQLGGAVHQLIPDRNEAVSYACTALATKGDIIIENARPNHLRSFLEKLDDIGAGYESGNYGIRFFYKGQLKATNVTTGPEPHFMTDWQPLWSTLMTQAEGVSTVHETVMEKRFHFVPQLQEMGAKIEYFQPEVADPDSVYNFDLDENWQETPHAIRITGSTALTAGKFSTNDIRHGACLIMAALTTTGTSEIHGAEHIDRGYENLASRLRSMGAKIERIE